MTPFDPTDPKYQLTPEFLPDKESTWSIPKEDDGWVTSHTALEGEIGMFLEALASIDSKGEEYSLLEWEMKSLKTAFAAHFEHVHWHHCDEDDNIVPFLKTRIKYPEKLESDHPTIEAQIDKIKDMIENIETGDAIGDLFAEWKKYQDLILPHIHEENEVALPLMRAYFTAEDLKPMVEYIVKNGVKIELGSMIYSMGPEQFQASMKRDGIPFFVWYVDFSYRLAAFDERFVKHVLALKSGNQPPPPESSWCNIM